MCTKKKMTESVKESLEDAFSNLIFKTQKRSKFKGNAVLKIQSKLHTSRTERMVS